MANQLKTERLGRYTLDRLISRGGMGEIYLASMGGAAGFKKQVVIKRILPHLAQGPEFVARFIDEAHIVVNLTHGNIVPVFDMGESNGEYFIAMEYLAGRDLRRILKRQKELGEPMRPDVAAFIITEVCKGLNYAHAKSDDQGASLGIIHRDISPSNVLVSREGVIKLTDFGIAKAVSKLGHSITGRLQGKFCYMSPEQAAGKSVSHHSDIFSLGTLAYELLTNERPFEGESDIATLELVRQAHFEPPSERVSDLPDGLDAVLRKTMSLDPAERYPQATDVAKAIFDVFRQNNRHVARAHDLEEVLKGLFPEGVEELNSPSGLALDEILALEAERILLSDARGTQTVTASSSRGPETAGQSGLEFPTPTAKGNIGLTDTITVSSGDDEVVPVTPEPAVVEPLSLAENRQADLERAAAHKLGVKRPGGLLLWLVLALIAGAGLTALFVQGRDQTYVPPVPASLTVTCELPDEADLTVSVLVNNENRAVCPVVGMPLDPGQYRIRVNHRFLVSQEQPIQVEAGETSEVNFRLQRRQRSVHFTNLRGFEYSWEDSGWLQAGLEPIMLPVGLNLSVHFRRDEDEDVTYQVFVEPDGSTVYRLDPALIFGVESTVADTSVANNDGAELDAGPDVSESSDSTDVARRARRVLLELSVVPEHAELLIDDVVVGQGTYTLETDNQDTHRHQVAAQALGYVSQSINFRPSQDRRRQYEFRLEPAAEPVRTVISLTFPAVAEVTIRDASGNVVEGPTAIDEREAFLLLPGEYEISVENEEGPYSESRSVIVREGHEETHPFFVPPP